MKLLHVYSGNLFGGIETMLLACARGPSDEHEILHEVALCFDDRVAAELRECGCPVHLLGPVRMRRPGTVLAARQALEAVIDAGRFDRVISHAPWTHAIFGSVVRRRGVPLVFWAHDVMTGRHWTERYARLVVPDLVVCNSAFTASTLPRLYRGVPAVVVHPPVPAASALAIAEGLAYRSRREAMREELGTDASAFVIVQASRCDAWKGHTRLLEALGRLADEPDWVWWIVGGAQRPEEEVFMAKLRAAAIGARLSDRIRWIGPRSDVPQLLCAADVLCQANLEPEPFGIAFIEAMAAGLPVVTVASGGALEIVDDTCGVLTPPDDPHALSSALRCLMHDDGLRLRLSQNAPVRAQRLCDPARQRARLHRVLESMAPLRATA